MVWSLFSTILIKVSVPGQHVSFHALPRSSTHKYTKSFNVLCSYTWHGLISLMVSDLSSGQSKELQLKFDEFQVRKGPPSTSRFTCPPKIFKSKLTLMEECGPVASKTLDKTFGKRRNRDSDVEHKWFDQEPLTPNKVLILDFFSSAGREDPFEGSAA